jgi:hypothetical protein
MREYGVKQHSIKILRIGFVATLIFGTAIYTDPGKFSMEQLWQTMWITDIWTLLNPRSMSVKKIFGTSFDSWCGLL